MKPFFTALFIGTILVLWGLSLIIESLFGVTLPIFKLGFAALLIYMGIHLISGMYPTQESQRNIFFAKEQVNTVYNDYRIVFGKGIIDLSNLSASSSEYHHIKIYTLCGNAKIHLNPNIPTIINATALFSAVEFPDKSMISLGSQSYNSHNSTTQTQQEARLVLDITAIFSEASITNS